LKIQLVNEVNIINKMFRYHYSRIKFTLGHEENVGVRLQNTKKTMLMYIVSTLMRINKYEEKNDDLLIYDGGVKRMNFRNEHGDSHRVHHSTYRPGFPILMGSPLQS
jgi:hypothetical protein